MSRPRQTKETREQDAKNAFRMEIKLQRVQLDMTQGELADFAGMDRSVLSRFLADPDKLNVGRLRRIIQALALDPVVILQLLGYDSKTIQAINRETKSA